MENSKQVSNPLTIIAIFAGLAEVAGTVAIKLVEPASQSVFVWFVMLFPTLLVTLFFLTLNFNPTVLYAPSDFREDESFLRVLKSKERITADLSEIEQSLEEAKETIIEEARRRVGATGEREQRAIVDLIDKHLARIEKRVVVAQQSAEQLSVDFASAALPRSKIQAAILGTLATSTGAVTVSQIHDVVKFPEAHIRAALAKLVGRGVVSACGGDGFIISGPTKASLTVVERDADK